VRALRVQPRTRIATIVAVDTVVQFHPADDAGRPSNPSPARTPRAQRGSSERPAVLVVDDEPANLKLARIVLEDDGFEVHTAKDVISALEVLKTVDPALIVMDVQLPGMSGWELTRRLKNNVATRHIPVIAVTAYGMKGDEERAREAGCVAYVAKPVSTRDLPAIIRRHLPPPRS
jgi:CheY-like chemotaxis protein